MVEYYLKQGNLSAAERLVEENGLHCEDELNFLREKDYISLARVCIARGKFADADDLLYRLEKAARAEWRFGSLIEILNVRAVALQALNKVPDALQLLDESVGIGEPEGYVRFFVEAGEPMRKLLTIEVQKGLHADYAGRLLDTMANPSIIPSAKNPNPPISTSLMTPLTEREAKVLSLIAAGCTNKEIAHKLYISLRTVKYHTTSIFNKLNVNNRAHAAVRARELGLLN
jgi:LuxR family maltose regulon positive regulatory protein